MGLQGMVTPCVVDLAACDVLFCAVMGICLMVMVVVVVVIVVVILVVDVDVIVVVWVDVLVCLTD